VEAIVPKRPAVAQLGIHEAVCITLSRLGAGQNFPLVGVAAASVRKYTLASFAQCNPASLGGVKRYVSAGNTCSWETARGCLRIFGSDSCVVRNIVPRVRPPVHCVRKSRIWIWPDGLWTLLAEPGAAYLVPVLVGGEIYICSREGRSKNVALRRDPRTAVVFAVPGRGGVTIIGRAEFTDDPAVRQRVFDGMADHAKLTGAARETFLRNLGSPGRMVFRIAPERYASRNERTAARAYASTQGMPSNYR
jgi:hypothetical protein